MNVERSTGKIQLTIVWNSEVYPEDGSIGGGIGGDDGMSLDPTTLSNSYPCQDNPNPFRYISHPTSSDKPI
jgi:hypothetical protein